MNTEFLSYLELTWYNNGDYSYKKDSNKSINSKHKNSKITTMS